MFKKEKDETLRIVFCQGFNSDEIEEITESFSKIVPTKEYRFATDSVETANVVIIFTLGVITGSIAQGFFNEIGSDLYRIAKEKFIRIFKTKQNPMLIFEMSNRDTKVLITSRTNDERGLNEIFDTILKARDMAIREQDKRNTLEIRIYYDNGWILDSEKTP